MQCTKCKWFLQLLKYSIFKVDYADDITCKLTLLSPCNICFWPSVQLRKCIRATGLQLQYSRGTVATSAAAIKGTVWSERHEDKAGALVVWTERMHEEMRGECKHWWPLTSQTSVVLSWRHAASRQAVGNWEVVRYKTWHRLIFTV